MDAGFGQAARSGRPAARREKPGAMFVSRWLGPYIALQRSQPEHETELLSKLKTL
jgi:hypothetical protein